MNQVIFIPKELILLFHHNLIQTYGGIQGLRDESLLDSALEQPQATFDGNFLHDTLIKMAAAYGYHLCNNHPFIDGNKRIALVAMDVFLQRNGYHITASEKEVYSVVILLSSGQLTKIALSDWLVKNTVPINS